MSSLSFTALAIAVVVSVVSGAILGPNSQSQELFVYHEKIYAVHRLLEAECPEVIRLKREIPNNTTMPVHLEVAKTVYNRMIQALVDCRENTTSPPPTTTSPSTTTTPPTTTSPSTTTIQSISKDCQDLYDKGERTDGVYEIEPPHTTLGIFSVFCEFSDGHGWTVIQKRFNGSVDFYRNWNEYKNGFGSPGGEHWLGNDRIHALTLSNKKLNIYVTARNGSSAYGTWQGVYVGYEADKYMLTVSEVGYSGTLPTSRLTYHNGMKFTTKDQDNDVWSKNCANDEGVWGHGGWWYKSCQAVNINGRYNSYNRWHPFADNLLSTTMRLTR